MPVEAKLDLSPASWLWLPGGRTLPNTALLFRKDFELGEGLVSAKGWIFADSRYRLRVNGVPVQWGPAPADPRWPEVDPIDLLPHLRPGSNRIEAEVLWFGSGEGTYIVSNPGFIFRAELRGPEGTRLLVSDKSWRVAIDRSLPPGSPQQWFLRALQECRDLRFEPSDWLELAVLKLPADKPTICAPTYPGGAHCPDSSALHLRPRLIPLMDEERHPFEFSCSGSLRWLRSPEDCFDFRIPDCFELSPSEIKPEGGSIAVPAQGEGESFVATFFLSEQMDGWPEIEIDAPEGTTVELLYQESHDPSRLLWLETHYHSWTRFVCREGANLLRPFDYFSLRWLQVHVRGNSRPALLKAPSFVRRLYPFAKQPVLRCSDPELQRLLDANVNTLRNSLQEGNYDGSGRERQQYSGDVGHQQQAARLLFGEARHCARYLRTYSDGLSLDGYFMDCWPGSDRLTRIAQRQFGATEWGPILDHGIQFALDCHSHYMQSGCFEDVALVVPKLAVFGRYLAGRRGEDGLVPVEHALQKSTSVWMDHAPHYGWTCQRDKACAFNLYAAAMYKSALAPLCKLAGLEAEAKEFLKIAKDFEKAVRRLFWCEELGCFVDNLPWVKAEGRVWLSDRTLSTALLFGFLDSKAERVAGSFLAGEGRSKALGGLPVETGWSYPPNAVWLHWSLIRLGRMDRVLSLLREWAKQPSVLQNNTLSEGWNPKPDTCDEWSHCPAAPLLDFAQGVAGVSPLKPGFSEILLRPQAIDVDALSLCVFIPQGRIAFSVKREGSSFAATYELPPGCKWRLSVPSSVKTPFKRASKSLFEGCFDYVGDSERIELSLPASKA